MDTLEIALGLSLIATGWLLPIGVIRMLAYFSGQVDHTIGMRNLAVGVFAGGVVAAVTTVALAVAVAIR